MGIKDYFTIGLGILGWAWAIIQFILNRKYQKYDKKIEKRFEVYSNFMNQIDEMSRGMRSDPNVIYGIQNKFMEEVLSGDEKRINNALLKFNEELLETTKKSLQPMLIISSELNKLQLIASEELLPKLEEYKEFVNDFTDEFQLVLNNLSSSSNLEKTAQELDNIGSQKRNLKLEVLWREIKNLMRNEIDYYKK